MYESGEPAAPGRDEAMPVQACSPDVDSTLQLRHGLQDVLERRRLAEDHRPHEVVVGFQLADSPRLREELQRAGPRVAKFRLGRAVELLLESDYFGQQLGQVMARSATSERESLCMS